MNSDALRQYPKDVNGAKNEWIAMVHHYEEINQELQRLEREIKQLTQKSLHYSHDLNVQAKLADAKEALKLKKIELYEMENKIRMMEEENLRKSRSDKLFQNAIKHEYDQQLEMKRSRQSHERSQQMALELQIIQDDIEKARKFKEIEMRKKLFLKELAEEDMLRAEAKKNLEKNKHNEEKNNYKEVLANNATKDFYKEENYKYYFQQCAENQKNHDDNHYSTVLRKSRDREAQISNFIQKNIEEEERRQLQKELEMKEKKLKQKHELSMMLGLQQQEKNNQYQRMLQEKTKDYQEIMNRSAEYQIIQNQLKKDKEFRQAGYNIILDKQNEDRVVHQLNDQKMRPNEKKLNIEDLYAWKHQDPQKRSNYVPGWNLYTHNLPINPNQIQNNQHNQNKSNNHGLYNSKSSYNPITNPIEKYSSDKIYQEKNKLIQNYSSILAGNGHQTLSPVNTYNQRYTKQN